MEIEASKRAIERVFFGARPKFSPLGISSDHTEYSAFRVILDIDWSDPGARDFEMAAGALPFLSPRDFAFVWAKYMHACLSNPSGMIGNEFTNQLFGSLTHTSANAFAKLIVERFRSFSEDEAEVTLRCLEKLGALGFSDGVYKFTVAMAKLQSLLSKQ